MMTEYELVWRYQRAEATLLEHGYKLSAIKTKFYIHNSKGTIVGEVQSIDGLQGFLQGVEWMKEQQK